MDAHELLMDEGKANSYDYKKKRLINIVNESKSTDIDIYSTLLNALYKRYRSHKRK